VNLIHRLSGLPVFLRARVNDAAATTSTARATTGVEPLRIVWTTPHGRMGKGGMDRLTQLVTKAVDETENGSITFIPLTTKGRFGKAIGAFIFAFALFRFMLLALTNSVHALHINVAAYGSAYRKMVLAMIARFFGVPYIVHIHSGKFPEFWKAANPTIARAVDAFLENSSAIIVLGHEFEAMVLARVPRAQGRISLMHNATPPPMAVHRHAPGGKLQLITLGLLGPNKNTTQLIDALGKLKHRSDWIATIGGNGEVEKARAQVTKLGIADRVTVPGWMDQPAVQRLLEQTDVFLLPSRSEGIPMAILEAFSYGIPVIATAVNSIPEVVNDGRNGLLVPVGDLDALVNAISRLLEDDDLRRSLGRQALRDHTEHYELNAYMKRLQNVWRQAACKPSAPISKS
jgi:glycosyltransferase involved in cell wall biosynthesis